MRAPGRGHAYGAEIRPLNAVANGDPSCDSRPLTAGYTARHWLDGSRECSNLARRAESGDGNRNRMTSLEDRSRTRQVTSTDIGAGDSGSAPAGDRG